MDKGLDEIISDKRSSGPRNSRHRGGDRRREYRDGPRDGVRKSYRDDPRSIDSEWVHDRFDDYDRRHARAPRRRRESPQSRESKGSRIKVENLHYDLTEDDLGELFRRIGRVVKLQLKFDRAGRSEGIAFVTYEQQEDAEEAIKQFDGANANGQPIRLTLLPNRNPFDTAVMPSRPLSERISAPGGRYAEDSSSRRGVDRYVPGDRDRSRSPVSAPRRRGGRRPGVRRDGRSDGRNGGRDERDEGRSGRRNMRTKKTQDELDADMDDYFTSTNGSAHAETAKVQGAAAPAAKTDGDAPAPAADDVDMIE